MSNIIALENVTLPAHLMNRSAANAVFAAGLPQSAAYPVIGLKGTRFVIRNEGAETAIPKLEISVILLSAKPNLDKTYYASKYDPQATEAKSPDCFSRDGQRPDPSSPLKQAEACAGCPMNQFGSGTGADGAPSKGKACADSKTLAIFANNGVYGFKIPPASLKAFTNYVKDTSRRNIDLSTCITVIGFDANFSFPVLTFNFGGFLAEAQVAKIDQLKGSDEVKEIVGSGQAAQVSPAVASAPIPPVREVVANPFEEAVVEAPKKTSKPRTLKVAEPAVVDVSPVAEPEADDELAALLGI